jgi:hypothetical protein
MIAIKNRNFPMKSHKGGDGPQEMVEALNIKDVSTPEALEVAREVLFDLSNGTQSPIGRLGEFTTFKEGRMK